MFENWFGPGIEEQNSPRSGIGAGSGPRPRSDQMAISNLISSYLICWKSKIIENGSEAYTNMCRIVSNSIKQKFGLLLPLLISMFD